MHPQRLAARSVNCDHIASGTRRDVEDAIDHEGRSFVIEIRVISKILGLPLPGDLEVLDVIAVDLIERRILSALRVATVIAPFHHLARAGSGLCACLLLRSGAKLERKHKQRWRDEYEPSESCNSNGGMPFSHIFDSLTWSSLR